MRERRNGKGPAGASPDPKRLEELFASALERPEEEWEAVLAAECRDDPELHRAVRSLLEAHASASSEEPGLDPKGALQLLDVAHPVGTQMGPYRLVEEIGRGGMGTVFRAERIEGGFEQTVALKLIKKGMDSEAISRRFLHERQVLARLEHPHIARLYDGGLAEDGRPYFAMELVDGAPLTTYCNEKRLSVDARLRLFLDVCGAVQHAHANLVIHRDLKPSNILVDGQAQIKLLDFGIARVLQDDDGEGPTTLTAAGAWLLTPEYAAPEQVLGEAITTSTDVYSLGVVLYELLTSKRPLAAPTSRSPVALARAVEEIEPVAPSKAAAGRVRLSRDLDSIVLKALRKEPARRYATAQALAEDLKRSLDGLPVAAHRDTLRYRARKFLRRHTTAVVATLGVIAGAVALTAAFTVRVTGERRAAEQARDASQQVLDYVVNLFSFADPFHTGGETVTAREMLDMGTERLEDEFREHPHVRAQLLHTNGSIYRLLGRHDRAEPLLRESLALWQTLDGDHDLAIARTLRELGGTLRGKGRHVEAIETLEEARSILEASPGHNDPDLGQTLHSLGSVHVASGHLQAGESLLRQALAIRRRSGYEPSSILSSLANVAGMRGRLDLARELNEEALAEIEATGRANDPQLMDPLLGLGALYSQAGDQQAAIEVLQRALAIARRTHPPGHRTIGFIHNNLGVAHLELDRLEEAGRHFQQALESNTPEAIGQVLNNLGNVELRLGHLDEAEDYYRRALEAHQRLPDGHPSLGLVLNNLGEVLIRSGRDRDALDPLERSRDIFASALGESHVMVSYPVLHLAGIAERRGELDRAEVLYRQAAELRSASSGISPKDIAEAEEAYTSFAQRRGRR